MTESIYILCALTSLACAGLLLRGYIGSHVRLLLWGSICFFGFAINNLLIIVDLVLLPHIDFSEFRVYRVIPALLGAFALMVGLILEAD